MKTAIQELMSSKRKWWHFLLTLDRNECSDTFEKESIRIYLLHALHRHLYCYWFGDRNNVLSMLFVFDERKQVTRDCPDELRKLYFLFSSCCLCVNSRQGASCYCYCSLSTNKRLALFLPAECFALFFIFGSYIIMSTFFCWSRSAKKGVRDKSKQELDVGTEPDPSNDLL